jgi:hypothetical protein
MLRLRGRHTDGLFELPVQFAPAVGGIVIVPGRAETKQWWRNLRDPQSIDVLSRGVWRPATGVVLHPDDDRYPPALDDYAERWPDVYVAPDSPVVLVTWIDDH